MVRRVRMTETTETLKSCLERLDLEKRHIENRLLDIREERKTLDEALKNLANVEKAHTSSGEDAYYRCRTTKDAVIAYLKNHFDQRLKAGEIAEGLAKAGFRPTTRQLVVNVYLAARRLSEQGEINAHKINGKGKNSKHGVWHFWIDVHTLTESRNR